MAKRGRKRIEEKHPEIVGLLGKMPDKDLAKKYGVAPSTIANLRRLHQKPWFGSLDSPRTQRVEAPDMSDMVVVPFRRLGEIVHVLHGHRGIRVYHRNDLDPRITMGGEPPFFATWAEADAYLTEGAGNFRPCLIPLAVAREVFTEHFDLPDTPHPVLAKLRAAAKEGVGVALSPEEVAALSGV